jgi:hypothetical protein
MPLHLTGYGQTMYIAFKSGYFCLPSSFMLFSFSFGWRLRGVVGAVVPLVLSALRSPPFNSD